MRLKSAVSLLGNFLLLVLLFGCDGSPMLLVNTVEFNLQPYSSVRVDYDAEDIEVLEGEPGKMVLKEFMNKNKKEYYAKTTDHDGELVITEGKRPRSSSFRSSVELYIPADYSGNLSLHSTSGTLTSTKPMHLANLEMNTTSGGIYVSNMKATALTVSATNGDLLLQDSEAETLRVETTNADTTMERIGGSISYTSRGGNLQMTELSGSGSFTASGDGGMELSFTKVTGDITAHSKNGGITINLPDDLDFRFSAITKKGAIATSFDDLLSPTDNGTTGVLGSSPQVSIGLESRNGAIAVMGPRNESKE